MRYDISHGFVAGLTYAFIVEIIFVVALAHYRYHVLGFPPEVDHAIDVLASILASVTSWYTQKTANFALLLPMPSWDYFG